MTICFICRLFHQFRAGLESYTFSIATALARQGHTVHIITEDKGKFYREDLEANIIVHPIKLKEDPFPGFWRLTCYIPLDDLRFSWQAARKIKVLHQSIGLDIVEAPDVLEQGFWCVMTKPTIVLLRLHGWFSSIVTKSDAKGSFWKKLKLTEKIFWWMQKNSIMRANAVSTVAEDFKDFTRALWQLNGKQIEVIHNAVDTSVFRPGNEQRELSVLFVGRMEHNKGIQVLAQAIPLVFKKIPHTKFYFAGRDTRLENTEMTAQEFILKQAHQENIVFLGELATNELILYYQRIAIGVFPSLYEPFGIVALESMACGCATIASNVGGLKNIIDHAENGLLVTPGNQVDLANAIIQFLQDDPFRKQCSRKAIEKVRNHFTLDQLATQTLAIYKKTISNFNDSQLRRNSRNA